MYFAPWLEGPDGDGATHRYISVPVQMQSAAIVGLGAFEAAIGVQVLLVGENRAPSPKRTGFVVPLIPPQIIACVPVHTDVLYDRADGQDVPVDVLCQESVEGEYRPPVLKYP